MVDKAVEASTVLTILAFVDSATSHVEAPVAVLALVTVRFDQAEFGL